MESRVSAHIFSSAEPDNSNISHDTIDGEQENSRMFVEAS